MKVSYTWLQTYLKDPLPKPEALAELFNAHAFEVEGLEKTGGDTILDVKVLPDRGHYALCHKGIALEASAIAGTALKPPQAFKTALDASVKEVAVNIEEPSLCQRYMARRILGVDVSASPAWLKERLEAVGARSINNVVDATNFVMFDIGQPLHAFDADKVKGVITVRRAKQGEKITVLDGREITLLESDLLIADSEGPLAIAGVKGGKKAEVTSETKNIIIEAANFNPTAVRRTSTRTNLRNDSSKRFENEITPALASEAIEGVTSLILGFSPNAKAGNATDVYLNPVAPWTIETEVSYINAVTGLALSVGEIKDILVRLACKVENKGDSITVTPPLNRLDMRIPEDVADEIGRMKGYDVLVPVETPYIPWVPMDKVFYWAEKTKDILVSLGFSETILYTLVPKGAFEISYPLASDKAALRERIFDKLAASLVSNAHNADLLGLETVRIFEIGEIFPKSGEKTSLAIGILQAKKKKGVTAESLLKETLDRLEKALGTKLAFAIQTGSYGAVAEIDFGNLTLKLPEVGLVKDFSLGPLPKDLKYKPFSAYPFIVRDVALFVAVGVTEEEVGKTILSALDEAARKLVVKGPDCFDRFEKEGKKSLAFRMIFQSFEKTLSDEETGVFMTKIYAALRQKGWEVR